MVNSNGGEPRRARRRSIVRPPLPSPAPTAPLPLPPTLIVPTPASVFRPESPFKREFGMRNDANGEITGNGGMVSGETGRSNRSTFKSQSVDVSRKALDRSDSTGSNVAALRNRYSRIVRVVFTLKSIGLVGDNVLTLTIIGGPSSTGTEGHSPLTNECGRDCVEIPTRR